jgi:sec-independent protein translocase protein TatC
MPLAGHLGELRSRLVKSFLAVTVGMAAAYPLTGPLIQHLAGAAKEPLVFLSPTEAFWTVLKLSFFIGLALSSPVVIYHVWRFVAPGLLPEERKWVLPVLMLAALCFTLGLVFCSVVVLPFAMEFLVGFGTQLGFRPALSVGLYVDFVLKFLLAFGIIFEVPLAITLMARLGWVTPQFLVHYRRYAILVNAGLAAVLTPTYDLFNMLLMMIPLIVFYELGILGARVFWKKRPMEIVEETR